MAHKESADFGKKRKNSEKDTNVVTTESDVTIFYEDGSVNSHFSRK